MSEPPSAVDRSLRPSGRERGARARPRLQVTAVTRGISHRAVRESLAVDRDAAALATLRDTPGIETHAVDLRPAPGRSRQSASTRSSRCATFTAACSASARHRWPASTVSCSTDTFAAGTVRPTASPSNPDFCFAPGELLELARDGSSVVAFEQGLSGRALLQVIQRIAAVGLGRRWPPSVAAVNQRAASGGLRAGATPGRLVRLCRGFGVKCRIFRVAFDAEGSLVGGRDAVQDRRSARSAGVAQADRFSRRQRRRPAHRGRRHDRRSPTVDVDEHCLLIKTAVDHAARTHPGGRRHRCELDRGSHRAHRIREESRRGDASLSVVPVLQQADAGRALPAFPHHRGKGRACRCSCYNVPSRTVADLANDTALRLRAGAGHRRHQGRDRRTSRGAASSSRRLARRANPSSPSTAATTSRRCQLMLMGGHGVISVTRQRRARS